MTASFIPPDALVLRPRTRRQRGALIAFLGVMTVSAIANLVRSIQQGTSAGYVFTAVDFGLLGLVFPLIIRKAREQLVAISDTHVFAVADAPRSVERARVASVRRGRLQDTLRDANGSLLLRLPDTLTVGQGSHVAALLGVPHLDRRGRVVEPSGPTVTAGPSAPGTLPVPPALWKREP